MITNCNIDSIDILELRIKIITAGRENKTNLAGFINALKELYKKDYSRFDIKTFSAAVVEAYKDGKRFLGKFNLDNLSNEDLIAIYTDPNTSVSEIIDNKTDSLELSDIFSDYSDSFISSVYGTSTAKDKLLRFFNNYLTDCTLIDFLELKEIHNSKAINTNLIKLQEILYTQILNAFKRELKDSNLPNKLFNKDGTVNLKILNTALYSSTKNLFTINKLLEFGDNPLLSKKFNALNALFILNHFDAMIKLRFNKMVKINHHKGVLTNAEDKYEFHFENTNKVNLWRDDSKDVNAIDETSDVNRMLVERIPLLGMDGKPIPNVYLNLQQVISMNTLIKSLASHPNAKIPINTAIAFDGNALSDLDEEINKIIQQDDLTNKSLQDLINEAIDDLVIGVRNLFTVLVGNRLNYNSLGIYSNMLQIIKSYYLQVFAPEGSYWEIYLNSLKENYGINDLPEFYFTYLTLMFGSHEAIDSLEYQRDGSNINNITLKESTDATLTYYIDAQIGGKFGINAGTKFTTFRVEVDSLKLEDAGKAMDPYIDIIIYPDTENEITVRKYGRHARLKLVEDGKESYINVLDKLLFKKCDKFLLEVLNFDFTDLFIQNLSNRNSNYINLIFSLVGNIIYNYKLTEKLNDDPDLVKKQAYVNELTKYYNPEEKISVRTDIRLIQFTNRSDAVAKILLSNSYDDVHNINRTNVTKDADNKLIGSNGLDLVATKPTSLWARSNKLNKALKAFSLNKVYRGLEFARDFKGPNGNKKATEFSEAENFIGTFMYDYLSRLYGKDETAAIVKLLPSIISDKSRIPKTLFDLNAESTIENDEGEYKKYKDLNTDEWKYLTKTELGNYYLSIYADTSSKFRTILDIINNLIKLDNQSNLGISLLAKYTDSVELDYDSNFLKFNTLILQIADSEHLNTGDLIQQILHEAILESLNNSTYSSVELTGIIHYNIDRNGNLLGNALLFDLLYRFGKIDINHSAYKAYGLNSGYGTFEEFWESKKLQYVGDLLKDDAEILRFDAYGNEFTGAGFKALKDWKRGENIVFANITYTVVTDEGTKDKTLPITSKWDLKNSFIYKLIRRYKGFPLYAEVKDFVNIDSPLFDFGKFMLAIQIYNNELYSQEFLERKIKSIIKTLIGNEIEGENGNKVKVEDVINVKDYVSELFKIEITAKKQLPSLTKLIFNENLPVDLLTLNSKFKSHAESIIKLLNTIKKYNELKEGLNIKYKFEINPFLERYQITDYMLSSEYINATVGTHINHPSSFSKPPIIWGHPALGKTYALNTYDFIDWDIEFNVKRDAWIANQTNTVIGTPEFKNARNEYLVNWENHEDFKLFVTLEWNRVKRLAATYNKMLIASPHMLLKLFPKDFDLVINIPKEDFIERGKNRGDKHPELWKEGIDNTIESVLPYIKNKIINVKSGEYLTDLIAKDIVNLKFNNLRQKESEAWGLQVKRNVSLTASKYKFALNLIDGIKSEYTVAVIEDDKDIVYNIYGKKDKVKPFDGATICGLGTNYLENRSLKGDHAGIDKKQFIHDYKANSGTGIIVKTAGFALTNWRIRNSKALQNINRKMLDIPFGNDTVDITRDYDGKPLLTTKIRPEDLFLIPESLYGDMTYVEFDGKHDIIYRTVGVHYVGKNLAHILRLVLTKDGWVTDTDFAKELISLDSNYAIYKYVFGGENSIDIKTNDINNLKLSADLNWEFSENSAKQLAFAMNRVGTKKPGVKLAVSQNDVYQPMKLHTIDYVITEGAIKQGAANINSKRAYYDPNYKWTTMKLGMYDAGIQLDAEHHADASTLSLMTQVLNVLGARGYSALDAEETYQAMYSLTNEIVKDFDLGSMGIKSGNHEDMQKFISQIILDSIKTVGSSDGNLITALSQTIMQEYQKGNKVTYDLIRDNMPVSNPATFNKMISSIAAALTKKCIRIPFPGSMDVLAPSNRLYLLYNDHLLSYYRGKVEDLGYKLINNTGEIDLGRTYKITYADGIEEELLIDDPDVYYRIKSKNIVRIEENLSAGRDLASYNITFKVGDVIYNMWDLDSIQDLYTTDKLFELAILLGNSELIENLKAKVEYLGDNSEFHNFLMLKLQNTLNNLHNGGQVKINGGQLVTISDLKIRPYEIIMTKIYETTFGLKPGDDILEIVNNKLFFCKRALENFNASVNTRHYDLELKVLNGQHVYLTRLPSSDLTKVENVEKRWEGDTLVWYKDGKKIRNLASEKDEIYMDSNGNEIIVTEKFNFYINDTSFLHLNISPAIGAESTFELLKHLQENENPAVKSLLENLGFTKDSKKEDASRIYTVIEKGHEEYEAGLDAIKEYIKNPELNFDAFFASIKSKAIRSIINNSLEIHTSFIKSLNTLAARIPAQSHQSFMAMRVVGFDESGKNTAYVNRMLLYLQGSDY